MSHKVFWGVYLSDNLYEGCLPFSPVEGFDGNKFEWSKQNKLKCVVKVVGDCHTLKYPKWFHRI